MPAPARALLDSLRRCRTVLLTGPDGPDGDSIGACLALQAVLQRAGVDCDVAGVPGYRYDWLPGADALRDDDALREGYDAVVVLDGDRHRLTPAVLARFQQAQLRGIIDHHASTQDDGYTHFWVEPTIGSTCEMLYAHFVAEAEPIDEAMAIALYTGLIFDTGGFRYSNTRPASHRMAADLLGHGFAHDVICARVLMDRRLAGVRAAGHVFATAQLQLDGHALTASLDLDTQRRVGTVDGDLEGLVESLVQTHGVEVAALAIQSAPQRVKLSLRSRGRVDVAEIARGLHPSGGGHAKAAGVRLEATPEQAIARLLTALRAALPR